MSFPVTTETIRRRLVITIDGPSGSGKSTTARETARRLGLVHLDTGAMYRAVTLRALESGVAPDAVEAVAVIAREAEISFLQGEEGIGRVVLNSRDVTDAIRTRAVNEAVSIVSAHAEVRRAMVRRQRSIARGGGVVVEGRDIGSVVLPSADVKIYLDASIDVRARRRLLEQRDGDIKSVRKALEARDELDRTRDVSPLKIPIGAHIVDTSHLTFGEQVSEIVAVAERIAERNAGIMATPGVSRRKAMSGRYWRCIAFVSTLLRLLWWPRHVRSGGLGARENFIFASNHRSNGDPPIVACALDREVHFVAKAALFKNRLFGRIISRYNAIPIRRGSFDRAAMDRFLELLGQGRSALIFPEGGRMTGTCLGGARAGVGFLALHSGCPVVPIYVDGTQSLKRSLFRRPRLSVMIGRPMRLTEFDLSGSPSPEDCREFGRMVMGAIEALKEQYEAECL